MGEHLPYKQGVTGSSPVATTIKEIFGLYNFKTPCGGVAQLVRALACHAGGRGFEPRHSRQQFNICAALAHLVEQLTCNQQVVGSNPTSGTI